jgi:hypothetical protein
MREVERRAMKHTKKVPQRKPKAKPKVEQRSATELSEDQLEKVSGGGGFPAGVANQAPSPAPRPEFTSVGFAYQQIEVTFSPGGLGAKSDQWEK